MTSIVGFMHSICVLVFADDPAHRRIDHLEQRERLGLGPTSKGHSNTRTPLPEPTNALQKVEVCAYETASLCFLYFL